MKILAAVTLALYAPSAWAIDCFEAGNVAREVGRYMAAVEHFEAALERVECMPVRAGLHMSIGSALLELRGRTGNPILACRATKAFAAAETMSVLPEMEEVARSQRVEAAHLCRKAREVAPPEPNNVAGWLMVGGAVVSALGGGLLLSSAVDERVLRENKTRDAEEAPSDSAERAAAREAAIAAHDRHVTYGVAGYALVAAGIGLAIGSYFLWQPSRDESVKIVAGPNIMGITGRF